MDGGRGERNPLLTPYVNWRKIKVLGPNQKARKLGRGCPEETLENGLERKSFLNREEKKKFQRCVW